MALHMHHSFGVCINLKINQKTDKLLQAWSKSFQITDCPVCSDVDIGAILIKTELHSFYCLA